MKKKILCLCLTVLLLTALLPVSAAGTTLTINAPDPLPAVGKTFTVKVSISGNPGLCAAQYTLTFDASVVDCQSVKMGTVLSGMLAVSNADASDGAIVAAAATDAKKGDGVLSEYTFVVLKSGNPAFKLTDGVFTAEDGSAITTNVEPPKSVTPQKPTDLSTIITPEGKTEPPAGGKQDAETAAETAKQTFSDVPATYWGYDVIEKAAALGLISGNPDGTFAPQQKMTRAQFVSVLYRLAKGTPGSPNAGFRDVAANSWYADAVNWAAANGYVAGDGVNFNPNGSITRQEVVTILFRYNGGGGMEMLLSGFGVDSLAGFTDQGSIAPWAKDAMRWAVFSGIMSGTSATTLSPTGTALRAEVAAFFVRYAEK